MAASAGLISLIERICFQSRAEGGLDAVEQGAIDHMNADHGEAIALYASHHAKLSGTGWSITGFDSEGMDLAGGDRVGRVWFDAPLASAAELRPMLVAMAKQARAASG